MKPFSYIIKCRKEFFPRSFFWVIHEIVTSDVTGEEHKDLLYNNEKLWRWAGCIF